MASKLAFQNHWDLVAKNVYDMMLPVFEGKELPEHLNETHTILLPKNDNPKFASQFHPIGLYNVAYKIITKIIVNCIKPLSPRLISNTQEALVLRWQIIYNIVLIRKVLHTMRRKQGKKVYIAIKIDFEK